MAIDTGKTIVLITGANRGIGFETVRALLKTAPSNSSESGAPYHVYLGARDIEKGKKAASSLTADYGNSFSALEVDINSPDSIISAISTIQSEVGRVDVLVNNAGIIYEEKDRIANLRIMLETNVTSTFALSEGLKPLLLAQASGIKKVKRIINVTSSLGSIAWRYDSSSNDYQVPYSEYRMSKAALNMLTACQSHELAEYDVKVFAFNPGYTVTELSGPVEERRQRGAWEADVPGKGCAKIVAGERDHDVGQMISVEGIVPW